MVIEFLNHLQEELLEEKIKLESKKKDLKMKIDENARYIQKLKDEAQSEFRAFSPRRNESLHEGIRSSENDQLLLLKDYEDVERKYLSTSKYLSDLNHVIKSAKNDAREIDNTISMNQNYNRIIQKVEFCTSLVDLDPVRCKMELSSLVLIIKKMMENK